MEEVYEIHLNDRLGQKCRLKVKESDTIGEVKALAAANLGIRPDRIRLQRQHQVLKDHISLGDYEIKHNMSLELYYI